MAALQLRGKTWRVFFNYRKQQYTLPVGEVSELEAHQWKAKVEFLLMRIKQRLLDAPPAHRIVEFIQNDGKLPHLTPSGVPELRFSQLRDSYLKTVGNGAIESNTLYTSKIHLAHIGATLGDNFPLNALTGADLQRHIDRRKTEAEVVPVTIKKEMDTFRTAWNWASRRGEVQGSFPSKGLVYPKSEQKLPFMTWSQIERRIKAGGNAEELWECLYLTEVEIAEFLDFVQGRKAPFWVYPMCLMAAHTGARRSEIMRAQREDVDFEAGEITVREKKRVRGVLTTRRVPISTRLREALADLPDSGPYLFGEHTVQAVQKAFQRVVGKHASGAKNAKTKERKEAKRRTKWSVVKGYHVLRHSFISALASRNIDQRIIQEFCGHMTAEMQRRYAHLYPSTKEQAIRTVFG